MANNDWKSYFVKLDENLELYLVKKAPALPTGAKEAIVKFGPWVLLVMMILAIGPILALLGLGTVLAPFGMMAGAGVGLSLLVGLGLTVVSLVLEVMALPGLFKRQMKGWQFAYYAALVGALQNVITFNLAGLVIGTLLSLYILYQIKSYYK